MGPIRSKVQITFADADDLPPIQPQTEINATWWAAAIGLVVIAYLSVGGSLFGSFLPQDDLNVTENIFLRATGGLRAIWRFCYTDLFHQFSPLGYSLYLLEYRVWGALTRNAAVGYRQVGVLLHVANVLLLWTLLRKLDLRGAFVSAAIFAAHPVQVQTVAWISQQPTLLAMGLALTSLIVYLRFDGMNPAPYQPARFRLPENRVALFAVALLLFVLSILAKPAMAVLPLVILLMIWWERGRIARADLCRLTPFLAISLLACAAALVVFRHSDAVAEQQVSVLQRIALIGPALALYLFEMMRLVGYSVLYDRWDPLAWWVWALLAIELIVLALLWLAKARIGRAPFAAAMLFVILLLPQILFIDLSQSRDSFITDSALYAASAVAIVSITASIADRVGPRGERISVDAPAGWIAGLCVLLAMGLSFRLSRSYSAPDKLWAHALSRSPNSVYALNASAEFELNTRQSVAAYSHLLHAWGLDPGNLQTHRNLAAYFESSNEPDRAFGEYLVVIKSRPQDIAARCGIARALAAQGDPLAALREYQRVLQLRPEHDVALNGMAVIYTNLGQFDEAIRCFQRAIQASPIDIASRLNLASLYFRLHRYDDAANSVNAAAAIDPGNFVIWINLGSMRGELGQIVTDPAQKTMLIQGSEMALRQALLLNHDSAVAAFNLAEVLAYEATHSPGDAGKMKEAVFYYAKACRLDPDNERYDARLREVRAQVSG